MSAIAKPVTILAGLLVAGTATTYTVRSKNSDFSAASLAASDMDAAASAAGVSKPKLPSEFFHITTKSGWDMRN
ncbi:hypothetical protein Q7P36_006635 [Cladosporium allicinum]